MIVEPFEGGAVQVSPTDVVPEVTTKSVGDPGTVEVLKPIDRLEPAVPKFPA